MPKPTFTQSEFILFVYLCMANIDNKLGMKEIEVLFEKMDLDFFSNNTSNELLVGVVFKKYKRMSPEQRLRTIEIESKIHLTNNQSALKILQNLHHIVKADGEINTTERSFFETIEQILNKASA